MAIQPLAEIIGVLTVPQTIIIYDGGFYSLDGGTTISTDTIGPATQIEAAAGASITVTLENSNTVFAKTISVPGGSLTVAGPGSLTASNDDVPILNRIYGVRALRDITVTGGATLTGIGVDYGVSSASSLSGITVAGASTLIGQETGTNTSITNASRYGINSGLGILVTGGSALLGAATQSYNTYGVHANTGHNETYPVHLVSGTLTGTGDTGIYSGSHILVDNGTLTGTGGSLVTSHGVQADRTGITVNASGILHGTCSGSGYAGVLATAGSTAAGVTLSGGIMTGQGGIHGIRVAGSGSITVNSGGSMTGTGNTYGVYCLNNDIAVADASTVTGIVDVTGGRIAVFAGGNILAQDDSTVEGFAYAYGIDGSGYFGAVIANGSIAAIGDSDIIENYSRVEYYNEVYELPYQDGKNMTAYTDYGWSITAGTGAVESDPGGQGIRATQAGTGTLTGTRTGDVPGEVVNLDATSTHDIHIPVILTVTDIPTYTVTYDGNGATDGDVPIDLSNPYHDGDLVTVLGNINGLVKEGSTFEGWSRNPDGSGIIYRAGDTFAMPAENVMLYAVWNPITYIVTYDPNGATSGTVPIDPSRYTAGQTVIVLGNPGNLVKDGGVFVGWGTTPDGAMIYQPGDTFEMPPITLRCMHNMREPPIPSRTIPMGQPAARCR